MRFSDGSAGTFHLHALVVSQSPLLNSLFVSPSFSPFPAWLTLLSPVCRLLSGFATSPRPTLLLPILDSSITSASLGLSLASLYSPSVLAHLTPANAPQLLATASYLGLERLATLAFDLCEKSAASAKTSEEVSAWFAYVERERTGPFGGPIRDSSPALGGPTPPSSVNGSATNGSGGGGYEARLRAVLFERVVGLAEELSAFDPVKAVETQPQLIDVLKKLPFEVFKAVVEDARFDAPSDMDRCASSLFSTLSTVDAYALCRPPVNFAKKVIVARKQLALSAGVASEFEETVVLQFGQSDSPVNVLRKPQRKPQLWKIGGH